MNPWNARTGVKGVRLANTAEMPRDEWLKVRRSGIGGSDIAAICGVNPFSSPVDVYLQKVGLYETPENEKMKWGKLLEPAVADEYSSRTGNKIERCNAILQHPDIPHFLANLDRLILGNGSGNGVLEIKTTSYAPAWDGGKIPDMYYCQLQWYLGICGLKWGDFAVLISGNTYHQPEKVYFDESAFKNLCITADRFWTQNVLKKIPPDPGQGCTNTDAYKILYPENEEKTIQLPQDLESLIAQRGRLAKVEKDAKSQKAAIDSKILHHLQDAKYGETTNYKVTRVLFEKAGFDSKSFKEANPKLYNQYQKSSTVLYPLYKEKKGS